jgi:hypothetical protein
MWNLVSSTKQKTYIQNRNWREYLALRRRKQRRTKDNFTVTMCVFTLSKQLKWSSQPDPTLGLCACGFQTKSCKHLSCLPRVRHWGYAPHTAKEINRHKNWLKCYTSLFIPKRNMFMLTKACGKDIKEKHYTIKLVFLKRFLFCFGNWFDKNKHLIPAFTVKVIHGMIPCQTV